MSLLLCGTLHLHAASPPQSRSSQYWIGNDLYDIARHPVDRLWKTHSPWLWVGVTGTLFALDGQLYPIYRDEIEPQILKNNYFEVINDRSLFYSIQGLYLMNANWQNKQVSQLTYLGARALVTSHFISQGLKHVVGRQRPTHTDEPHDWLNYSDVDPFGPFSSFPSSHATWYFSFTTVAGKVYGHPVLADVVGASLYFCLANHNHWASDMWMGYLLGKAIGTYTWKMGQNQDLEKQWFIYPFKVPGSNYTGIGAAKRF